ncbi:Ubiquitin carboxyl-terminal hydrolase 8 [Linum perenne]
MTRRLSGKLSRLSIFTDSTGFFSFNLARFSLSTLRFFKTLLSRFTFIKTLARSATSPSSSMDDDFLSSVDDNNFLELDLDNVYSSASSSSANHHQIFVNDGDEDFGNEAEKLYLVPLRWWSEVQHRSNQVGVLYDVDSRIDDEEIQLCLHREDKFGESDDVEEGFSGKEYALLTETMWLQALKWHNDSSWILKDVNRPHVAEDNYQDIFSLQIRLSVSQGTNSLIAKINFKVVFPFLTFFFRLAIFFHFYVYQSIWRCIKLLQDNLAASYRRACTIFASKSKQLHIWDFSGETTQFFMSSQTKMPNGLQQQQVEEITLELHVHGFSEYIEDRDGNIDEEELNSSTSLFSGGSVKMNGTSDWTVSYSTCTNSSSSLSGRRDVGFLGLKGLENLGNTCFMNSAIQCLVHTPKLVDYFLGDYKKELNRENPLGMRGELALAFGDLLRKLWSPGSVAAAPRLFKLRLATFAPQFSGYNQHDSQEFLAFLLDGLHEDLNRVKNKPYIEVKDAEGRPDTEVAAEYWSSHMARNDSIVVDLFQGQYRSMVVCPFCKKSSITFDPFMYLSLPLPSTTMRTMTLTVLGADGTFTPSPVTVTVPNCGRLKDLTEALSTACSLRSDETLLLAEIYKNKIFSFFDDPTGSLALIRDDDTLVAYRLPKESEASPLVVFTHKRAEKPHEYMTIPSVETFGIPFVTRLPAISKGLDLCKQFLKLLNPFLKQVDEVSEYADLGIVSVEDYGMEDASSPTKPRSDLDSVSDTEDSQHITSGFMFCYEDDLSEEIKMEDPLLVSEFTDRFHVSVCWLENMIAKYDTSLLCSLRKVSNLELPMKRSMESVSLYKCLESFLKEEPLGPEDMWYCPNCKKPRQATKKLDLWRLPEILVIHLKRFSYNRYLNEKLETYVDFPTDDLDLSTYISYNIDSRSCGYALFAISNHYGGMGSGHYTAFVDHGHDTWYEFNDERVYPVSKESIRSSAAYVLFYRRV